MTNTVFKLEPIIDTHAALSAWESIYDKNKGLGPFLTTEWISSWLKQLTPNTVSFATLQIHGQLVACCFVSLVTVKLYGLRLTTAYINQSGSQKYDQVWIEYNDILGPNEIKPLFFQLLTRTLEQSGVHRLYASMCSREIASWNKRRKLPQFTTGPIFGFLKQISDIKTLDDLNLSSNTRIQLKRSNKNLESMLGAIEVFSPITSDEQNYFFEQIAKLHKDRWGKTSEGSGFDNPHFTTALKAQLSNPAFATLLCVRAGKSVIGYAIFYTIEKTVYFYCSGINYSISKRNKHIKPGYSLHLACMQYFSELGYDYYDFLGGDAQYKRSLSDERVEFYNSTVYLENFGGRVFRLLHTVKSALKRFKLKMNRWQNSFAKLKLSNLKPRTK